MAVSYDSPTAMWAGILGTLALSVIGVQKGTSERFTAPEGVELTRQVRGIESGLKELERELDIANIARALVVHEMTENKRKRIEDFDLHRLTHRREREELQRIRDFLQENYGIKLTIDKDE